MDITAIAKKATSIVIAVGVSKIFHDVIASNVDIEKVHHKVAVPVASFAIGGAVAEAASTYTDDFIDQIADAVVQFQSRKK